MFFPSVQFRGGNCKREMVMACAVVRRNDPARSRNRLGGFPAFEEQQDVAPRNVESREAVVSMHFRKAQQPFVKTFRAREVVNIEAGFKNAVNARHGNPPQKPSLTRRSSEIRDGAGSCLASSRRSTYFARMSPSRLTASSGTRSPRFVCA